MRRGPQLRRIVINAETSADGLLAVAGRIEDEPHSGSDLLVLVVAVGVVGREPGITGEDQTGGRVRVGDAVNALVEVLADETRREAVAVARGEERFPAHAVVQGNPRIEPPDVVRIGADGMHVLVVDLTAALDVRGRVAEQEVRQVVAAARLGRTARHEPVECELAIGLEGPVTIRAWPGPRPAEG